MTGARTPTTPADLVAHDGSAAHDTTLQHRSAPVTETAPGTAAALTDRNAAAAVVRQRAPAMASAVLLRQSTSIPTELGLALPDARHDKR